MKKEDAGAVSLQTVLGWIADDANIKKTHPIKKTESERFQISVKKQIIDISAGDLLAGPGRFRTMCFGKLGIQMKPDKKHWSAFTQYISDSALDVGLQDTAVGMDADHLLEIIVEEMTVTDDVAHLADRGNVVQLVEYVSAGELWYVIPSSKIRGLVSEESIRSSTADISAAMDTKEYKRHSVHTVRFSPAKNDVVRCWWFYPRVINGGIDNDAL